MTLGDFLGLVSAVDPNMRTKIFSGMIITTKADGSPDITRIFSEKISICHNSKTGDLLISGMTDVEPSSEKEE